MSEWNTLNNLCYNGHVILWAWSTTEEIPEGMPCCCGLTVTHYAICKECGNRKLEFIPIERKDNG